MAHRIVLLVFSTVLMLAGCKPPVTVSTQSNTLSDALPLHEGDWLLEFDLGPVTMPVQASISSDGQLIIKNASEHIVCSSPVYRDDSIFFRTPVFDNEFRGKIISPKQIKGTWHNLSKINYAIPFTATYQTFPPHVAPPPALLFTWEAWFSKNTKDAYKAIGVFKPQTRGGMYGDNSYEGTFMTETGDYRYLSGYKKNDSLMLSAFDGSHVFFFQAMYFSNGDSLRGKFYSGNHWTESWIAGKNPKVQLKHPDSLTRMVHRDSVFHFSFPDINGKTVSYPSPAYANKVTIIQIMGSWCPNCMDETTYLMSLYRKYQSKGVEIVSLCFERSEDFQVSVKQVTRMKETLHATYPFLIAGSANKGQAIKKLPMLNHIMSFPTTIYLDRKGRVRKIYTGFYGPSTGKYHERFVEENQRFIEKLLSEQ